MSRTYYVYMHRCRYGRVVPATNSAFWQKKRHGNVRDRQKLFELRRAGWSVLVVWECWTRAPEKLASYVADFLRH